MAANEWSEKTRMIVTISIGVVANVALGVLFYFAYSKHAELSATLKKKQTEKAGLQTTADTLPQKIKDLAKLQTEFEANKKKLPSAAAIDNLYNDMAPIANRNKTNIPTFRRVSETDAGAPGSSLTKITINAKWEGSFWGFVVMLNEIEERFPRFLAIENLNINPKNGGMVFTGMPLDFTADVVTYTYKEGP